MPDGPAHVIGPFGEELTLDRLPPANTVRWTVRRKAEVVAAVRGGLLTFDEACARYALAMEELISWQGALQKSGMRGLRITAHKNIAIATATERIGPIMRTFQ